MFLPSTITLKPGDSGDFVAELQRRLSKLSLFDESQVSGFYDEMTTTAVRSFQSTHGLQTDGIAGPETIRRLNGAISGTSETSSESSNNEEEKEADRLTLKDSLMNTMAQEPELDPALLETAKQETHAKDTPPATAEPAVREQEAALQKEAQTKAAEHAQANIQQQSQLQEMLMEALKAKNSQAPAHAEPPANKMPPKEVVESEKIAQKEAQSNEMAVKKEQIAQQDPQALAAQKEQAAQLATEQASKEVADQNRNPLLQKLVEYVESRLPKETIREVLNAGGKMLRAGVQQATMPEGDTARAPEATQARGQEQAAQRGA